MRRWLGLSVLLAAGMVSSVKNLVSRGGIEPPTPTVHL